MMKNFKAVASQNLLLTNRFKKPTNKQFKPGENDWLLVTSNWYFWIFSWTLMIAAIIGLGATVFMMVVLRFTTSMESIEFDNELTKLIGNIDLDNLYKANGRIEGFKNIPMEIGSENNSVYMHVINPDDMSKESSIELGFSKTHVKNIESFIVGNPKDPIFTTLFPNFGLPKGVRHLDVATAFTNRVVSPVNETLTLKSSNYTRLKGNEGTLIDGSKMKWSADGDLFLRSVNGTVILSSADISLDVQNLPVVLSNKFAAHQYKLCICMPSGMIFRVPIPNNYNSYMACNMVNLIGGDHPCT
ncbi:beta-sarcoglycan-like [Adelges cooleyi]|uniref:beta-sarcoglycan-like n=1 Tax=Adelges cooleyi TaxID=133065 RepID=UPI002180727A|nr:beta-sarcoglycan-like [Adelges cooleyi]XP_050434245.1 beta-sarcoglycan-like [Adelges cooleyi]XP_050436011.1 beta-sarcoglycan-like [Adelges cooleyi]XP_050436019.1 beta-sarcoglycan-like [Adelges cooleyi]